MLEIWGKLTFRPNLLFCHIRRRIDPLKSTVWEIAPKEAPKPVGRNSYVCGIILHTFQGRDREERLYDKYLKKDSIMVNCNKVTIFLFIIMMIMCLDIKYSYSKERPSEIEIRSIIILLEKDSKLLPIYIKNVKYNAFDIIQEFISRKNGRYCIKVNLDISYDGRKSTLVDFKPTNLKLINKRYSFVRKYNQWLGYHGWGPGED